MDDSISIGSSSDQDDDSRMQYIRQESLQTSNGGEGEDGDDESSKFFVSEPSTSEADSSENTMRLGALGEMGWMEQEKLLQLIPSASEEDNLLLLHLDEHEYNHNDGVVHESSDFVSMPLPELFRSAAAKRTPGAIGDTGTGATPPLPPNAVNATTAPAAAAVNTSKNWAILPRSSPVAYSLDNTSLSSHDTSSSPGRVKNKVELNFSTVQPTAKINHTFRNQAEGESTDRINGGITIPRHQPSAIGRNIVEEDSRKQSNNVKSAAAAPSQQAEDIVDDNFTNSSSSASEAHVQQLGEFLDDLRINSEGQMKESLVPGSNTSFEPSIQVSRETEVKDVLRRNNSTGALYGRRGPAQPQQSPRFQQIAPSTSRDSSISRLLMDYSKDSSLSNSRGATGSPAMGLPNDAGNYRHREQLQQQFQQQHDTLAGATIEMMASAPTPTPSLPPLYVTTLASGRKQQHDRQRQWSVDTDNKSLNQDPKNSPDAYYRHDNTTANTDINPNINQKSTIDNSGDEWNQQQKEIGLFSQFAIGTKDSDGATRRGRRSKQRSYRQLRTGHLRQESGEDSSSQASSDQSYINFFQTQSLSQASPPQSKIDPSYQATTNTSTAPRTLPHGQYAASPLSGSYQSPSNLHSPRNRSLQKSKSLNLNQPSNSNLGPVSQTFGSYDGYHAPASQTFGSYDGYHAPARQMFQQSLPPQLDPNNAATMPWGNPIYQSSPTHYLPAHNHHRGNIETPVGNQQLLFEQHQQHLHHQYSHIRSHSSAVPMYQRPPDGGNRFLHPEQHFSTIASHVESPAIANQSHDSLHRTGSFEHDLHSPQMEQQRRDSYVFDDDTSYSVSDHSSDDSIEKARDIHLLHDDKTSHDNRVIRHHHFDNATPKFGSKFDRNQFLPQTFCDEAGESKYPTFVCPNCNMRQREFFTVSSAPRQYESEGTMISLAFAVYVVASLYIFGLQEGWGKLDCIYFAVITLTTAGLGDFVPTTDGAKIICSIFIYFGVACIGLLLGSYIAGMLDEKSYREAVANQIKACPNCARIKNMRYITEQRRAGFAPANDKLSMEHMAEIHATSLRTNNFMERASKKVRRADDSPELFQSERISPSKSMERNKEAPPPPITPITPSSFESPNTQKQMLGSPMTTQILRRQSHTRHGSMDLRTNDIGSANRRYRHNSVDIHIPATVNEGMQSDYETKKSVARDEADKENQNGNGHLDPLPQASKMPPEKVINDDYSTESSDSDIDSLASEVEEIEGRGSGVRNAKYVILTLREALVNSLVILAFGCLGFYLVEGFTLVDSMYFTTVLLTSTGYGDIVPKSDGGKLFATVYLLVGGTILLNNMSMISMIPLELRKRRTEHSVLTQFGDALDDDALRELATGPLIQRIHLGGKDPRGLDECTREMFALAMMIRLGKVTEHDINLTFAAFRKLDVHNEGILNSKTIITGMIQKRRRINLANRNSNNQRSNHQTQHTGSSWINPQVPSHFDGTRNRSMSTHTGSFDPNLHGHNMNHSDHAPLLSMSDRGFPQYGMNQYPFVPTLNE